MKKSGSVLFFLLLIILAITVLLVVLETQPVYPWKTPAVIEIPSPTSHVSAVPDYKKPWWGESATQVPPTPTSSKGTR